MAWAPAYITAANMRGYARIGDSEDDPFLEECAEAACRSIDLTTGRQFGLVDAAEQREYEAEWNHAEGLWEVDIDDVMTTEDLVITVDGLTVASSDYRLLPRNAPQKGRPWEILQLEDVTSAALGSGPPTVLATSWWGWSSGTGPPVVATPTTIVSASKMLCNRWFMRRNAPFGVSGSPEMGGEIRVDGPDKDVAMMVRPFWTLAKARGFA